MKDKILEIYNTLFKRYGSQRWWPVLSENACRNERARAFEISIGAILTQNTAWKNVEKAIKNLNEKSLLSPEVISNTQTDDIAECVRPAGYYNQKAQRLRLFSHFFLMEFENLKRLETEKARQILLGLKGIGPETADSILLYALNRPVFVIDAYTKRMFSRLLNLNFKNYNEWQGFFHKNLENIKENAKMFNEYHALIVEHCKNICKKEPKCKECTFDFCLHGKLKKNQIHKVY